MDFSGVKSWTIPEGSVKQVDVNGVTVWEKSGDGSLSEGEANQTHGPAV